MSSRNRRSKSKKRRSMNVNIHSNQSSPISQNSSITSNDYAAQIKSAISKTKNRSQKKAQARYQKRDSAPIILSTSETPTTGLTESEMNEMRRAYKRLSARSAFPYKKVLLNSKKNTKNSKKNKKRSSKSKHHHHSQQKKQKEITQILREVDNEQESQSEDEDEDEVFIEEEEEEEEEELLDGIDYHLTLRKYGYIEIRRIAKSLQGIVIEAEYINKLDNGWDSVIVKITSKQLHANKISNKNGKSLSVKEDIIKEKKLLMYLTANNPPSALTKFLGFFEDKINYFLVQENGGSDFFDWIVKCHQWIRDGKISLKQWNLYIHDLMIQIIEFMKWLHFKMNVCHLDISLENMLIKNNKYKYDRNGGIRLSRKMVLKFCDFGLAEFIEPHQINNCKKYVGKTHYKAPKVYGKKELFNARKADIWSLGVSFFMMLIGAPPYKLPLATDDHYPFIQDNNVQGILKKWGRDHYITEKLENLLNHILNINEKKRYNIYDIENHIWFTSKLRTNPKDLTKQAQFNINNNKYRHSHHTHSKNKNKNKEPKPPVLYGMSSPSNTSNHFQSLVSNNSNSNEQLFRYRKRKRKLTST